LNYIFTVNPRVTHRLTTKMVPIVFNDSTTESHQEITFDLVSTTDLKGH